MGMDVYATLIVGVKCTKQDFVTMKDEGIHCGRGHKPENAKRKFCSIDGGAFARRSKEVASENFVKYMKEVGGEIPEIDEDSEYDNLFDEIKLGGLKDGIGIYCIDSVNSYDHEENFALGIKLHRTESHRSYGETAPIGYDLKEIEKCFDNISEHAKKLGLTGKTRMYICTTISV